MRLGRCEVHSASGEAEEASGEGEGLRAAAASASPRAGQREPVGALLRRAARPAWRSVARAAPLFLFSELFGPSTDQRGTARRRGCTGRFVSPLAAEEGGANVCPPARAGLPYTHPGSEAGSSTHRA